MLLEICLTQAISFFFFQANLKTVFVYLFVLQGNIKGLFWIYASSDVMGDKNSFRLRKPKAHFDQSSINMLKLLEKKCK